MDSLIQEHYKRQQKVDALLAELGKFLGDLVEGPQEDDDEARLIDAHLQTYFNRYYNIKTRNKSDSLSVAILALTKSGKSTFVNALLARDVMPVNNVPETARICKIVHLSDNANTAPFLQMGGTKIEGEAAIRTELKALNSAARSRATSIAHGSAESEILEIHSPIAVLEALVEEREDQGTVVPRMYLLDTPGPNEAGEESLRHQVERLLDSVDAVIYLLDYTKLKTAEEAAMFERLKTINPALITRLSTRLFFVVNKVDQAGVAQGMSLADTREYVAELVTEQLACEGFQLTSDQVLLMSAQHALLARLVLADRASPEMAGIFKRVAFGAAASRFVPDAKMVGEMASEMLKESGIEQLEERVLSYLYRHSSSLRLMALMDDVGRLLAEAGNVARSVQACLEMRVSDLEVQARRTRCELEETLAGFDNVLAGANELQVKVVNEIKGHLHTLRSRLYSYILYSLDIDPNNCNMAQSSSQQPVLPAPWMALRSQCMALYGPGGGGRSTQRSDVEVTLLSLHDEILRLIHNEVRDFWAVVESSANGVNAQLVAELNSQLDELARSVEGVVGTALGVRLEHADLSVAVPDAEEFHGNITELVGRAVVEADEKHLRVCQRQFEDEQQPQRPQGLCRFSGFFGRPQPMTRTVVETYCIRVYGLAPAEMSRHYLRLVEGAIGGTEQVLAEYVKTFTENQIATAKERLTQYNERYVSAMSSSLEVSHLSRDRRLAALDTVKTNLEIIGRLKDAAIALGGEVEEDVNPSALEMGGAYEQIASDDEQSEGAAADDENDDIDDGELVVFEAAESEPTQVSQEHASELVEPAMNVAMQEQSEAVEQQKDVPHVDLTVASAEGQASHSRLESDFEIQSGNAVPTLAITIPADWVPALIAVCQTPQADQEDLLGDEVFDNSVQTDEQAVVFSGASTPVKGSLSAGTGAATASACHSTQVCSIDSLAGMPTSAATSKSWYDSSSKSSTGTETAMSDISELSSRYFLPDSSQVMQPLELAALLQSELQSPRAVGSQQGDPSAISPNVSTVAPNLSDLESEHGAEGITVSTRALEDLHSGSEKAWRPDDEVDEMPALPEMLSSSSAGIPFDYSRGFASAMSTSVLGGSSDDEEAEWTMVDQPEGGAKV